MKYFLIATFLLLAASYSNAQRKVQLVILFDTSNSMDGLLNQAKSRIYPRNSYVRLRQHGHSSPTKLHPQTTRLLHRPRFGF